MQPPDLREMVNACWGAFAARRHVEFFAEYPVFLLKLFGPEALPRAVHYWADRRRVDRARAHRQRKHNGNSRRVWFRVSAGNRPIAD